MAKDNRIQLENNARFSQSKLWDAQRHFYDKKGVQAWAADVPFYITSNPFIAYCYAQLIMRFILDCQSRGINGRFHIIELGTGTGQFSFYVLRHLHNMAATLKWNELPICYVMTDFTQNNIAFWENNASLKPFLDNGTLDFARFDVENDKTIELQRSNKTLAEKSLDTPLIVIANYLFDSVVNDVFAVKDGVLSESLVTLETKLDNIRDNQPKSWQDVKIKHHESPISGQYYENPHFNKILFDYQKSLEDTYFNFPNGSLNGIENLNRIANGKMLLISSDKGYADLGELDDHQFPELDFHGSFSLMVNYHAIGEYFKLNNGDAFLQTPRDGLATGAFVTGFHWQDLPQTSLVLAESVEGFSPTDYFHIFEWIEKRPNNLDLVTIASMLSLSQWDPHVFMQLSDRLTNLLEKEDNQEIADFIARKLALVAKNFYFVPDCEDIFFAIGTVYYTLDDYNEALKYYEESLKHFPEELEEAYYNIALCHHYEDRNDEAIHYLTKLLEVNPKYKDAKILLHKLQK